MNEINERLAELRKYLKLNQTELGEKINISKSHISSMEKNVRPITERTIDDICREFNVNEDWLRTGEGKMFIQMSEDEKLASFFGKITVSDDNDAIKVFMKVLADMNDEDLQKTREILELFMKK